MTVPSVTVPQGLPGPLGGLNDAQRAAVLHADEPLLIIAGAGSVKTQTLACRVAELLRRGADPQRVLLLTFTRRAAVEMSRRAVRLMHQQARSHSGKASALSVNGLPWAGTFTPSPTNCCACMPLRWAWILRLRFWIARTLLLKSICCAPSLAYHALTAAFPAKAPAWPSIRAREHAGFAERKS